MDRTSVENLPRARSRAAEATRVDDWAPLRAQLAEVELRRAADASPGELPDVYEDCAPRAFML
jgi:hypothetical protein